MGSDAMTTSTSASFEALTESAGSQVRSRAGAADLRAHDRVCEYLRAQGLSEPLRVQTLAEDIVAFCQAAGRAEPAQCVMEAQRRVDAFRKEVFGARAHSVDPLWLRTFIALHPFAFLGDPAEAKRCVEDFGDPVVGTPPARERFRDQAFARMRLPRWLLGLLPPALVSLWASGALLSSLARDGLSALEGLWVVLFTLLFAPAALGASTATLGFLRGLWRRGGRALPGPSAPLPRTALLMPIYHESAESVFAALAAMRESLAQVPGGEAFEIFVLSDSRDPRCAAEEERAFRRVAAWDQSIPVYYRRRSNNTRHKAGNLAEFFERFGHRYTYAVILDADSLMRGETLVEMVRRMEASPALGLLQAPLSLHRGQTLFARAQQFVTSLCGPLFTRGLAVWADHHGNYFGHNAVVRVRAFLDCCALPELKGVRPFGGHILSHDFVEAALLCRAGWEVRIAHDLTGSWEELPQTLPEYVARDRRWCQGNLQHLPIALSDGLKPMSRLHMLIGITQYFAGPLWLVFVGVSALACGLASAAPLASDVAFKLTLAAAAALLWPRLLGYLETIRGREARRAHGGWLRLTASTLLEALISCITAPLLMLHHTRMLTAILSGRTVRWGAQNRSARTALGLSVRSELPTTLLGAGLLAWLVGHQPQLLWWLSPVWAPWSAAIPLSLLSSSVWSGRTLAALGLLRVPSETMPDDLALRADELRNLTAGDSSACFRDLVLDPVLNAAHVARLEEGCAPRDGDEQDWEALRQRALQRGPTALSDRERERLLAHAPSMRQLHREAWQYWPVESWQLARLMPQLPIEEEPSPSSVSLALAAGAAALEAQPRARVG